MQGIVLVYTISIGVSNKYDLLGKICFNILDCFFISQVAFPPSQKVHFQAPAEQQHADYQTLTGIVVSKALPDSTEFVDLS